MKKSLGMVSVIIRKAERDVRGTGTSLNHSMLVRLYTLMKQLKEDPLLFLCLPLRS